MCDSVHAQPSAELLRMPSGYSVLTRLKTAETATVLNREGKCEKKASAGEEGGQTSSSQQYSALGGGPLGHTGNTEC